MQNRRRIVLVVLLAWAIAGKGEDLGDTLRRQYQGKILLLRRPQREDFLQFDAEGKPLRRASEGAWSVYGALQVNKLELLASVIRIYGSRIFLQYDTAGQRLTPFPFKRLERRIQLPIKESAEVEIRLDRPLDTEADAQAMLGRVFAMTKEDFINAEPEFWRDYLGSHMKYEAQMLEFAPLSSSRQSKLIPASKPDGTSETVYKLGKDVEAPQRRSTPEPSYSDAARYERFSGTLLLRVMIDKTGKVARVDVLRPLGLGLDEKAAHTVQAWTFDPATHNGEPVAVELNVEVGFHIY